MENSKFILYEYKNTTVDFDTASMYKDCLKNFGWILVEEQTMNNFTTENQANNLDSINTVSLKFKRDHQINNKLELNRLEHKCEEALSAIHKIERKNKAYTMGATLGTGILGTAFLAIGIYNFVVGNPIFSILFIASGVAFCAIGFLAYFKVGEKQSNQTSTVIDEQFQIAYGACEKAYRILN